MGGSQRHGPARREREREKDETTTKKRRNTRQPRNLFLVSPHSVSTQVTSLGKTARSVRWRLSSNQQTQLQRETETRKQRKERRPSQKVPTCGPQSHRTFSSELHFLSTIASCNHRPLNPTHASTQRCGKGATSDGRRRNCIRDPSTLYEFQANACSP